MGADTGNTARTDGYLQGPLPTVDIPTRVSGKVALTDHMPMSAADIGNAYIEGHGHCAAGGPDCFLDKEQRRSLIDSYQKEVEAAETQYSIALAQIGFETLIKKDDDLPFWVGMMIDVIAAAATDGISLAFKVLQKASAPEITHDLGFMLELQAGGHQPQEKPSAIQLVQAVDSDSLRFVAKSAADLAKKEIKNGKPGDGEKAKTLDYISRLQETSAIAWEHQWLDPPSTASDAELIVLFHSFKAANGHTAPRYKIALEEKISRYKASPVSRIGREEAFRGARDPRDPEHSARDPAFTERSTGGRTLRDTKVVWVQISDDLPPRLYYYKRDAGSFHNSYIEDHLEIDNNVDAEDSFHVAMAVEDEFVETALARHHEVWKDDPQLLGPETLPAYDMNRYAHAGANTAKRPASPTRLPPDNRVSQNGPSRIPLDDIPWSPMTGDSP